RPEFAARRLVQDLSPDIVAVGDDKVHHCCLVPVRQVLAAVLIAHSARIGQHPVQCLVEEPKIQIGLFHPVPSPPQVASEVRKAQVREEPRLALGREDKQKICCGWYDTGRSHTWPFLRQAIWELMPPGLWEAN